MKLSDFCALLTGIYVTYIYVVLARLLADDGRDLSTQQLQTHVSQEETLPVCVSGQGSSLFQKLLDGSRPTFYIVCGFKLSARVMD